MYEGCENFDTLLRVLVHVCVSKVSQKMTKAWRIIGITDPAGL